ncbi:MAG: Error-prone repair protein ImuA [Flavipsychrobacter sp.]|nr:Error-prone repair protein ImuA [Flavipsychrobacter sp.]
MIIYIFVQTNSTKPVESMVKADIINKLQREVFSMQGFKKPLQSEQIFTGLSSIEKSFPNRIFPTGVVHEFISHAQESSAATNGFISGLTGCLMQKGGVCIWIGTQRTLFPPTLKVFGIDPDRVIFIDLTRPKDALWAIEEALKCNALTAVVGEIREMTFTESRRLQLAVEESKVTGFIHRFQPRNKNTVACVTRWQIEPIASVLEDSMPGVGSPRWNVQLLKVRNGKTGTWQIEWLENGFRDITMQVFDLSKVQQLKTGSYA